MWFKEEEDLLLLFSEEEWLKYFSKRIEWRRGAVWRLGDSAASIEESVLFVTEVTVVVSCVCSFNVAADREDSILEVFWCVVVMLMNKMIG